MPTHDYTYRIKLNPSTPNSSKTTGQTTNPAPLTDADGTLNVNETFVISGVTYTVIGIKSPNVGGGEFIAQDSGGTQYLFTDTSYASNTTITYGGGSVPICFLAGTLIETSRGEVPVQELKRGDLVRTVEGDLVAVTWLGRQTISRLFAPSESSYPICIKAGALAPNVPRRDLFVSPDHALLVDGLLVHASALVNGTSIVQMTDMPRTFMYYHVETEGHRNILAEGAAAETFVDNVSRQRFDNYDEFAALYPEPPSIPEQTLPRVTSRRLLPRRVAERLNFRAAA